MLILYYSKRTRLRAAVVTLVSSRFGDVALFGVCALFYKMHCFTSFEAVLFLVLVVLTKRASYPFTR